MGTPYLYHWHWPCRPINTLTLPLWQGVSSLQPTRSYLSCSSVRPWGCRFYSYICKNFVTDNSASKGTITPTDLFVVLHVFTLLWILVYVRFVRFCIPINFVEYFTQQCS
jgi:hypothetical protein